MIVVHESGACGEVKLVLELIWELCWVAHGLFVKLRVHALVRCLLKHVWTEIQTGNVFESLLAQVFTDEAGATGEIEDFGVSRR